MDSDWRGKAEPLFLEGGAHLEISVDGADQAQAKVRVLARAERTPAAFGRIVRAFPRGVV